MNAETTTQNKQILANPISAYSALNTSTSSEAIEHIKQQQAMIDELSAILNEQQLQGKKISRQIGQARKSGQDIEGLKSSMQQLSKQQKNLSAEINKAQQAILQHFDFSAKKTAEQIDKDNTGTVAGHRNAHINLDTSDNITISQLHDEHAEWNDYVDNNSDACLHHRCEWKQIMEDTYGHSCFYYLAQNNDGIIVGILPLVQLKSRLFGNLLVSMPYFQRAGTVADNLQVEDALLTEANKHAKILDIEHIEYRDDISRQSMPVLSHKVNMVLELPDSKELLWKSFTSKLRSQIKRPQREETTTTIGGIELLDDFYRVYARNMRDLGSPLHSKALIKNILQKFPDNSWLVVIKLNGRAVAGGFLLAYKDTMEIPLASTIRDVNRFSINMLLYWQILQFSIESGYRHFDFGRSTKGAGTYRFKKQWGATAKPLYWHYWLNEGTELPGLNPANPKFAMVIYLWKRLPIKISQWLGPHIIKNIP